MITWHLKLAYLSSLFCFQKVAGTLLWFFFFPPSNELDFPDCSTPFFYLLYFRPFIKF